MKMPRLLAAAGVLLFLVVNAPCQQLTIQLEDGKSVVLNRSEIEALPHLKFTAAGKSDVPELYEGVTVKSVLEKAGVTFGDSLKGKRLATCLLVEASDGYKVVFALPELDPAFTDKQIVLVFLHNNKPLDDKEGPFRIVIPDEKRMARWVRQVTTLKVTAVQ
jgi:hypothetical protein